MFESTFLGRDSVVVLATRYGPYHPGIGSRWERFSAPVQTGPGAHLTSFYNGYELIKAAGA
jgi:hypothetical protein